MSQLIYIDNASLDAWRQDDLTSATAILSREIRGVDHHRLANLALVKTRLKQWELAEQDARASIRVQRTVLAYIALSIALGGQGRLASAMAEFNRVFLLPEPKSECLLLLVKSIIVFVAGGRDVAMRRATDVVAACGEAQKAMCRTVQAQMQLLVGQTALSDHDYDKALKSFSSAGVLVPFPTLPELETISLMFGWDFSILPFAIRQQTCEALYAASRINEATESLRTLFNEFGTQMKAKAKLSNWFDDFAHRCVKVLEVAGDTAIAAGKDDEAMAHYSRALSLCPLSEDLGEIAKSLRSKATRTEQQLPANSPNKVGSLIQIIQAHKKKDRCEALYVEGRIIDAAVSLLELTSSMSEDVRADKATMDWLAGFRTKCIQALERIGDEASMAEKRDEAVAAYSTVLLLVPPTPNTLLVKWTRMMLMPGSASEALAAAAQFNLPRFDIYRTICNVLEEDGRLTEAIECFRQMQGEQGMEASVHDERAQWELDFQRRCAEKLEELGDIAMNNQNYVEATEHFSVILSLGLADRMEILVKRSKARALMNSWEEALSDADELIKLDPSSHTGYEQRHGALHGMGRYSEAFEAFKTMLSKLEESPDLHIRGLLRRYIDATPVIRRMITQVIRPMPRVLIDTTSGRLYGKEQQAMAFETLPLYDELRSSMTIYLNDERILGGIKDFYQYVMFSHKWEYGEPLFQKVEHVSVYDLEPSSTNIKLQKFCSLVRSLGFRWAWSDTCCIDKRNTVVLQESLVAMFTWYRGSSLTIVYLRDVLSQLQHPGNLQRSVWNTRAWTYQEYIAAEFIQFYTKDWKPYLGLTLFNHKESPTIISEMQQVTGVSAEDMALLSPSLNNVRLKLFLASMRETTYVEDIAYSLLGIFNVAIPVIYGEGDRAVGRLLEYILTGSGDVTVLAWTGRAGSYNTCLPVNLTVYNQLVPPHVPQPIETVEMDRLITALGSSLDHSLARLLYEQLNSLPSPALAACRLQLPGIISPLPELVRVSRPDPVSKLHLYHVTASMFGDVEIRTIDDLTGMNDLYLAHPWIRPLLDQEHAGGPAPSDETTRALRLAVRLRQPFGALLFEQISDVEYRRVATDSLIMVRIRDDVPLTELMDNIRTIDVQ